jgi:transcriptional regulator with XRE-family HTH domain
VHSNLTATEYQIKDYRIKLGDKIRLVREQRGYSQEHLADIMGINRSTISKIENGKFSITVDYLVRFSLFLDYEFKVVEKQNYG